MSRMLSAICAALCLYSCSNQSDQPAAFEAASLEAVSGAGGAVQLSPQMPPSQRSVAQYNGGAQAGAPEPTFIVAAQAQAPGSSQNVRPVKLPAGALQVVRAQIVDRNGFEKPIVANTILVPAGWKQEGGLTWTTPGSCVSPYTIDFRATAPDGRSGVAIVPQERWYMSDLPQGNQPNPCPQAQIESVQAYLSNLVSRMRPNARIVDFRRRPDAEKPYEQLNQVNAYPGSEMRSWIEGGEMLIAYTENGADMRELIGTVVMFSQLRFDPMPGMPGSRMLNAMTMPGFSMRAPNGQLDFKTAEMIRTSGTENPEWSARMAKYYANLNRINAQGSRAAIKGAADRSNIIAQTGDEIRQMQMDGWRSQNESSDRNQRETIEGVYGVETYNDPYYGGTVQLDHAYDDAWQLNDGSYVLSNDAMYDPGPDATKLEVTE